jgi:16S rRNA (cytosine967-C5)-methyltransferase
MASLALESATVHARLRAGRSVSTEEVEQLRLVPAGEQGLFSCTDPNAFFRSRAFTEGRFYVQDPATLVAPALLHVHSGEVVADLCAAPGGKALVLGDSLAGTGCLVCMDRSERRLQRLVANADPGAARTVLVGDAARAPLQSHAFDAVLLDVPCSNTGVLRRRPDAKWRFSAGQLAQLVGLQAGILEDAARLVRPGGRLVYSTCSLEPEENGDQVRAFAARHPEFTLTEERALLPDSGHDGAYCALLGRRL